jgi:endoglucanase
LEAPKSQSWDVPMDISYFSIIKQAGFQCVRLPIRFSDYVDNSNSDYLLDETFMTHIDTYINEALNQDLTIIIDLHHFTDIMDDPANNKNCLVSIWKQLAARYKEYPDTLVFELLNEPQNNLDSNTWNEILADTVSAIRTIDKKHYLIVGGANYNSIDSLCTLELPNDNRLIATIHYYEPNNVTFQGDPYHEGYETLNNITWNGTTQEIAYLKSRLETAKNWADEHNVPLFLGEFGISKGAPIQTRISWTAAVTKESNTLGISYGYWEFASGFGIYDLTTATWNNDMLNSLLNP